MNNPNSFTNHNELDYKGDNRKIGAMANAESVEVDRDSKEKLRQNSKVKKAATGLTLAALTLISAASFAYVGYNFKKEISGRLEKTATLPEQKPRLKDEFEQFEGSLSNGVYYNYSDYYRVNADKSSDRLRMKSGKYGKDVSYIFYMPEDTPEQREEKNQTARDEIMKVAKYEPEALASYAFSAFSQQEKASLGIQDKNSALQIEAYMSDENNRYGGMLQKDLLAALRRALDDEDSTFEYYLEYGNEDTYYIGFHDVDSDSRITPNEMTLCKESNRKRNGVPQIRWYRKGEKVLDLNMECGLQPCFEAGESDPEIPEIGDDDDDDGGGEGGSELERKNEQAEIDNAGPRVDRRDLDEDETPETELWEDQVNFDIMESIRRQREEMEAENQRIAEEQAEAERRAAEEAEARRRAEEGQVVTDEDRESQRQADEASAAAEAEAAERQRQAEQAERERRAEEEARRAAQEAAERQAAEEAHNAENMSNNDENRDANDFNNGEFDLG